MILLIPFSFADRLSRARYGVQVPCSSRGARHRDGYGRTARDGACQVCRFQSHGVEPWPGAAGTAVRDVPQLLGADLAVVQHK